MTTGSDHTRPITVVAVHGNGCAGERFDLAAQHLPPDVHLVAPTLPGFGGRPMPAGGTHSLHPYVDDLAEVVDASVGDGPVVLLGHGVGGSLVMHGLTHRRLPGVDALVLHAPVGATVGGFWVRRFMSAPERRGAVRSLLANPAAVPMWRRLLLPDVPAELAERFLRGYEECEAFGDMFDLVDVEWFASLEPAFGLPARVLWGRDDRYLSVQQRHAWEPLLPDGDTVAVEGWGHAPMLADPADYAMVVAHTARRLLGRHPGPVPLGRGLALDRPDKIARLDRAAVAGLPVPPGIALPDAGAADPRLLARQVVAAGLRRVVVRSAFEAEDGEDASHAGTWASVVGVDGRDVDAVQEAITEVLASAGHDEVGVRDVLVQQQVAAQRAGVAFVQRDFEDDLVDHVAGLADGLVSGDVGGARLSVPTRRVGVRAREPWQGRLQDLLRDVREWDLVPDADVEWADDGGQCWLVQVRPITAPPFRDETFTPARRDVLPDLPSTFTTSLFSSVGGAPLRFLTAHDPDLPRDRAIVEELAGRPLVNTSVLRDTLRRLGLPTSLVDELEVVGDDEVPANPLLLASKVPVLVRLLREQLDVEAASRRAVHELRRLAATMPSTSFTEQVERLRAVHEAHVTAQARASLAATTAQVVLRRLGVAAELLSSAHTAGTRIWSDLAPLAELLDDDGRAQARAGEVPDDPTFRVAFRAYLGRHGHRGVRESDIAEPRFTEDPRPLLRTVADPRDWPVVTPPSSTRARLLRPLWTQAHRAIRAREDLRSDAMQVTARLRQDLLGSALAATTEDLLPAPEALWDLTLEEVGALDLGHGLSEDAWQERRRERRRLAAIRVPHVVRRSDDLSPPEGAPRPAEPAMEGLPLTAGEVTGTVWRADDPREAAPDVPGPVVLVAPAVAAGWVAAFNQADAVVVERGGELSHGSIVLREAGLPAVTNVVGATRLRDGQVVRVQAAAGTVQVVDDDD